MLKDFYLQVDTEGHIRDILGYPYKDYIHVKLNSPLPSQITSGAYQYKDGEVIYRPEWDISKVENENKAEIETLKSLLADTVFALASIQKGNE